MYKTLYSATWIILVLSVSEFVLSNVARVLLVVENVNSHVFLFSRLGFELASLGHDVRVLAPSSERVLDFVRQPQHDDVTGDVRGQNTTSAIKTTPGGGTFNYTTFAVDVDSLYATVRGIQ